MADIMVLANWEDVHVAARDVDRYGVQLNNIHDLMIVTRVSFIEMIT